jgi:hypothetical protein
VRLPLAPGNTGAVFHFEASGVQVDGRWLSSSPQVAAMALDAVSIAGFSACEPGTYVLPRSE